MPREWIHKLAPVAAVLFLAAALGYYAGSRSDRPPGAGSVEVGFLHDMIAHHEQALQLANVELERGADPAITTFAREILLFQAYEIGVMERQLEQWGYVRDAQDFAMAWMGAKVRSDQMPGLATDAEMDALAEASGAETDALFIALMRDHHAAGVHMASVAAERTGDRFVREFAQRMARNQRIEIGEMARARDRAGLSARPPGFEADLIPPTTTGEHPGHG